MKVMSLLCELVKLLLIMNWFTSSRLYSVIESLWRLLGSLWRCMRRGMRGIVGFAFLSIGWRKDPGSQREPEINNEDKLTERSSSEEVQQEIQVQESLSEGQHEATWKRTAETNQELTSKRPRIEEEDEEESDSVEDYRVETTDELYCDYDSTWDTMEQQEDTSRRTRGPAPSRHYKFSRFESSARDMQNYRHGYPSQMRMQRCKPVTDNKPNLKFYLGETPSLPDGVYIHNFHNNWYQEYDSLEYVHSYIQWLFPLQEPGMNYEASPLTREEIEEFLQNSTAKTNLLKSYKLMLDFYGIRLCNEETGQVERASNWRDRFNNLNSHTHNNLRITRILKCQGTLGFPHYQAPLVRFFLEETLVNGQLPNVKDSVLNYFLFAVLDKTQRRSLIKYAYSKYDRKDEFVWCPKKIQMMWSRRSEAEQQQGVKGNKDACASVFIDDEDFTEDEDKEY
ncbi:opioid growth factor receptor-like [Sebastes fasciatus]|uniref:opioid growth factor receptor-like n=1 Tax=Sebastes fasciatus TaxID=394691 RepID=UPI003D9F9D77